MISLGDIWIQHQDMLRITGSTDRLHLVLRWPLADLPMLMDLPERVLLNLHRDDDTAPGRVNGRFRTCKISLVSGICNVSGVPRPPFLSASNGGCRNGYSRSSIRRSRRMFGWR